jgi:hypothetical protein
MIQAPAVGDMCRSRSIVPSAGMTSDCSRAKRRACQRQHREGDVVVLTRLLRVNRSSLQAEVVSPRVAKVESCLHLSLEYGDAHRDASPPGRGCEP